MARRLNGRSISIHRSYLVYEIANALGVHRGTVLRWIRQGELKPIDGGKPIYVHGRTLLEFLERRKPEKQNCELYEWLCMKCREPRQAAFDEAEIISSNRRTCNIRALCRDCTTVMHKRFSNSKLADLCASVTLTAAQDCEHLVE